tara:strand:- start:150 stop:425 length:276 start_codon:yes stop_codon:yes gene_type:complete
MAKKATITCSCDIEVRGADEYEALDEVVKMIEREYPLSEKITLIIKETITSSSDGCGIQYKEKENGNVRRDNCSEVLSEEFADEGKREAVA